MAFSARGMHKFSPLFRAKLGCEHTSGRILRYEVDASDAKRTRCISTKHPRSSVDVERNEVTCTTRGMDGRYLDGAQRA